MSLAMLLTFGVGMGSTETADAIGISLILGNELIVAF